MRVPILLTYALWTLIAVQGPALAGTVTVMTSGGFRAALDSLIPTYEKDSGDTVFIVQGPSMGVDPTAIPNRLAHGEHADVVIMVKSALDDLKKSGNVKLQSVDLARSEIAMAIKAGTPKPDISSVPSLRITLLNAKSVAYSDSASGVYLQNELFEKLGIADEIQMHYWRRRFSRKKTSLLEVREVCGGQILKFRFAPNGRDY